MKSEFAERYRMLGLNIAYYRRLRGLTQLELAELLNIDRTHISSVESGSGGVSLDVLFDFEKKLNIPLKELFDFRTQ